MKVTIFLKVEAENDFIAELMRVFPFYLPVIS